MFPIVLQSEVHFDFACPFSASPIERRTKIARPIYPGLLLTLRESNNFYSNRNHQKKPIIWRRSLDQECMGQNSWYNAVVITTLISRYCYDILVIWNKDVLLKRIEHEYKCCDKDLIINDCFQIICAIYDSKQIVQFQYQVNLIETFMT